MRNDFNEAILNDEIRIKGFCNTASRECLLEEAIGKLQTDPENFALKEYYGIKNYANFGDQRADCSYGMRPRHGTIVFSIGRGENYSPESSDLYVDLLLYFRDFRNNVDVSKNKRALDLSSVVIEKKLIENKLLKLNKILEQEGK
jgi:hypothetical protein